MLCLVCLRTSRGMSQISSLIARTISLRIYTGTEHPLCPVKYTVLGGILPYQDT
jgi:hypothetical protein